MLTREDFTTLYAAHSPRLLRAARLMLLCDYHRPDAAGEAEDLCADVWARLWERWPALEELPTAGYLFAAVRNAAIDAARRRRVIGWLSLDVAPADYDLDEPGRWLRDPRDRYEQCDQRLDLAAALGLLTPTERRAFLAFHVADDPHVGIVGQQKMARLRARRRLQRCEPLALYTCATAS